MKKKHQVRSDGGEAAVRKHTACSGERCRRATAATARSILTRERGTKTDARERKRRDGRELEVKGENRKVQAKSKSNQTKAKLFN